jgi:hypothetical protein
MNNSGWVSVMCGGTAGLPGNCSCKSAFDFTCST